MCLANSWRSWVICENSWARQFGDLTERRSRDEVIYLKERYERTAVRTDTSSESNCDTVVLVFPDVRTRFHLDHRHTLLADILAKFGRVLALDGLAPRYLL